jgi:putative effector of murein hydrolase LrgA (UPF0299 family)
VLEVIAAFFLGTIVQCLPALIALMAWGEGGHRLLKQFGARMLWEVTGLVVVGVAILLYSTGSFVEDEGGNILVIAVASMCSVLLVTALAVRLEARSSRVRGITTAGASLFGLQGGLALGVLFYMHVWPGK